MTAYHLALFGWRIDHTLIPTATWRPALLWLLAECGCDAKVKNLPTLLQAPEDVKARFMEMLG